ncbi:hypothetical protein CHS0354_005841 [Potamilus streckersoni]|uniref:Heat shock 70 kDa protein 12A n=1 Tax=Potamilus streckersoni TaxID=2493646 RepID=A0AAE0TE73_9BIVA|nr:hypothetical protein CHS0354_005841 [Potamilus streckersoni]
MEPDVVIALDIGSTYSGYACQFRDNFKNNPKEIWMNNRWGSTSNTTSKTTTCVLIKVMGKERVAIGDNAEMEFFKLYDKYDPNDQKAKNEALDYLFFKNFKMILYDQTFKDDEGKKGSAEDYFGRHEPITFVMSKFIEGLKEDCIKKFKESRNLTIPEENIRWVITVPAIWNDDAKKAMRISAVKAGIPDDRLILALEPEAAAVHCMHLSSQEKASMDFLGDVGDKFMVVDLGGGTVDITAFEVIDDGCLKQITRANGGPWGGQRINDSFSQLVRDVFQTEDGKSAFASCKRADLLKMEQEFEQQKVNILDETPRGEEWIKLPLPADIWDEIKGHIKVNPIKYSKYFDKQRTGLVLKPNVIAKESFGETISQIVKHLQAVFREASVQDIRKIVLVGGFAEAPIVREKIQEGLSGKHIFVPTNPFYAVLRGAVLYGHNPDIFKSRISRFTYGICVLSPFDPSKHDESRKTRKGDGTYLCKDIFDVLVKRDQIVALNVEQPTMIYHPHNEDQTKVPLKIYQSESQNPIYVTDKGCKKLGTLIVEMPDTTGGCNRKIEVTMIYGGTELGVKAIDKNTGKEFKTEIAFDRYSS